MSEMLIGSALCTCAEGKVVTESKVRIPRVFWHASSGQGNFYFFSYLNEENKEKFLCNSGGQQKMSLS